MADAGKSGQSRNGLERSGEGGPAGVLERITAAAGSVRGRVMAMPSRQRRWLAASGLMIGAVSAAMLWYAGRTDWRILFSGLDGKDTQQVAQELSAAGIAYQLTEDGAGIRVATDQVDKARMEVAAKGMPQSGRMGFELFDKPNWVGSEFDEKVNYQRALEGELEHTIGTLTAVRSARVHLVLPKDSLFATEQNEAKASVVLKLRGAAMPPEQAESIRNLVAGAVENLSAAGVTLMDADGRVNLSAPNKNAAAGEVERGLEEKLVSMLEPAAGRDNVRATVTVSNDEGSEERTDEVYDPAQVAMLTMQKSEQTTGSQAKAGGVPGTASNTPGAAAPGSVQAGAGKAAVPPLMQTAGGSKANAGLPVYPQGESQGQNIREESGTYAVTKHLLHTEQGPGRVRRLTAAVVVNDRLVSDAAGKPGHAVWKPRSAEEMQRLEHLARAAVGFEAQRGDEVVIENVSFSSNVPQVAPPMMEKLVEQTGTLLHAQPGLLKTLSVLLLSVLLVIFVLRPMARQMMAALDQPRLAAPAAAGAAGIAGATVGGLAAGAVMSLAPGRAGDAGEVRGQRNPALASPGAGESLNQTQGIFEHVSEHIRKEPAQSTRLLESWISSSTEKKG